MAYAKPSLLLCGCFFAFAAAAEWEVIKLSAGVHEASSIKYWNADAANKNIYIDGGRKVRIEGEGKGKTVIQGGVQVGKYGLEEENSLELVGLTIADSKRYGVAIYGKGAVGKVRQCEIRASKYSGVYVSGGGKIALEESDIRGNGEYGVLIKDESSALGMRKCNLWDNKSGDEVKFGRLLTTASASDSTLEGNLIGVAAEKAAAAEEKSVADAMKDEL